VSKTSIFVCPDPGRSEWQLGRLPPAAGRMMLIGWNQEPAPVDGGIPRESGAVLARALASVSRVTFPSSVVHPTAAGGWSKSGGDDVRRLNATAAGRVAALLKGTPGHVLLVSTRNPNTVMQAFEDPGYPWWMQGQVLLLSESNASPPEIERNHLLALFEEEWAREAQALAPFGIVAVVRPGVDGDVAGLLSLTTAFNGVVLAALEHEARLARVEWSILTEDACIPHRQTKTGA
jgi:hypothetical protein